MTILEVVRQAVSECGSLAPGDVVRQLILTGWNPSPVNDVFRALETIQTGNAYLTNQKKAKKLKLTPEANPASEMDAMLEKQKARYAERKALGICQYCSDPAENGKLCCAKHQERERLRYRKHYFKNSHSWNIGSRVKQWQ